MDHKKDNFWKKIQTQIHSDLFLESAEFQEDRLGKGRLPVLEYERNGLQVTEVRIETQEQSVSMKRPIGSYITIFSENLKENDGGICEGAVEEVAAWIQKLLPADTRTVFVVGLGNPEASPDALGPDTVGHVYVNRHLKQKKESEKNLQICAMSPGVMAQTGLETAGMVAGITKMVQPDAVVVVDALAAGSVTRLGTTIQLTNTGISPGSGIGNCRQEISQKVLGVPVIAVGIPMVVEAAAIIYETMNAIQNALKEEASGEKMGFLNRLSKEEQYHLFRELLENKARPLYVTVKDVDEMEKRLSFTLSEALNRAFSGMKSVPGA